jgi:hypothetical protein
MSAVPGRSAAVVLLLALCLGLPWHPTAQAAELPGPDAQPIEQVIVSASKFDRRTLEPVIVALQADPRAVALGHHAAGAGV